MLVATSESDRGFWPDSRVNYEDGTEEVVGADEIYYRPAGHTVVVEGAVRMVEFSPHDQMSQVLAHVVGKL